MALDNLKKLVDVLADLGNVADKIVGEHGGLVLRLAHLMPLSGDALLIAGVDWSSAKAELVSLDEAGKQALLTEMDVRFQIGNQALELKIEEAMALAVEAEELIVRMVAFGKSFSAPAPVPAPAA